MLRYDGYALVDGSGKSVAPVVGGIPRFVKPEENYAESFGWQWKKWTDNQSESRGATLKQRQLRSSERISTNTNKTGKPSSNAEWAVGTIPKSC